MASLESLGFEGDSGASSDPATAVALLADLTLDFAGPCVQALQGLALRVASCVIAGEEAKQCHAAKPTLDLRSHERG